MADLNRAHLQRLARTRLLDARVLIKHRRYAAAYYIVGYAVECALKACIAKQTRRHAFPNRQLANDCYTHNIQKLVDLARLASPLERTRRADTQFGDNWAVVRDWSFERRYDFAKSVEARDIVRAVGDPAPGVLRWLQGHW